VHTLDKTDVAGRIETFLRTQFDISPDDPGFTRTGDFYELGYVDSVGVAELLEFLSEEFGVEVPESELLSDEFSSIEGIARIVRRLAGPAREPQDQQVDADVRR
jgi:acyl carrier protein